MATPLRPIDPLIYLIMNVDKTRSPADCWRWTGGLGRAGYGKWRQGDKSGRVAHRVVYELLVGPVDSALQLDHLCRVRECVNPRHLDPVSKKVNDLRGMSVPAINARKTACKRGHLFSPENTYVNGGHRTCRACKRLTQRARIQKHPHPVVMP